MKVNEFTLNEALEFVQSRRSIVLPNEAFMRQLGHFEDQLNNERTQIAVPVSTNYSEILLSSKKMHEINRADVIVPYGDATNIFETQLSSDSSRTDEIPTCTADVFDIKSDNITTKLIDSPNNSDELPAVDSFCEFSVKKQKLYHEN